MLNASTITDWLHTMENMNDTSDLHDEAIDMLAQVRSLPHSPTLQSIGPDDIIRCCVNMASISYEHKYDDDNYTIRSLQEEQIQDALRIYNAPASPAEPTKLYPEGLQPHQLILIQDFKRALEHDKRAQAIHEYISREHMTFIEFVDTLAEGRAEILLDSNTAEDIKRYILNGLLEDFTNIEHVLREGYYYPGVQRSCSTHVSGGDAAEPRQVEVS